MMPIGSSGLKFRKAAYAACLAVLMTCGTVGAAEVPLVDGTHWTKSAPEVKKAYLVGLANAIQVDVAFQADNPKASMSDFSPKVAEGMKGHTLDTTLAAVDKWYAAHPDQLQRPVVETIWFEMVVPGLKKTK
ncbi:conserved exported hypothetical protein [Candidatus Propionivibrio aalborgensis]|uniref:Uncharacterized protein n=1 Tax=Candidatus Propionivibrio aalborgensis TaxID=1860101 RepID=A0A1A8Y469_9RHOO|nr:hypothetical protein [Candidatus Propionivibrio aalborgensis]MBP6422291.1 hypothetical protein [Propionivibrio sp.]SBT11183.1 conserved exported hypothetical protein [Candidatus Propionivibrio aalborgensis]